MKQIALDIETDGLRFTENTIKVVTQHDGNKAFIETSPSTLNPLRNDREYLIHNSAFDLPFLDYHYQTGFPPNIFDTLVAERLITAGLDVGRDLKTVAKKYLDVELNKTLQTSFGNTEISAEQYEYAKQDTEVLFGIQKAQLRRINAEALETVWSIEKAVTPVFCKMIRHGIRLDGGALSELIHELEVEHAVLKEELEVILTPFVKWQRDERFEQQESALQAWLVDLAVEEARLEVEWQDTIEYWSHEVWDVPLREWSENGWLDSEVDRKDGKPKGQKRYIKYYLAKWRKENNRPAKPNYDYSPINLDSPSQLLAALNNAGIEIENTSSSLLRRVLPDVSSEQQNILRQLIDYKKKAKLLSSFGESLLSLQDSEGRVYPNFNQYGTATGRPSCSSPNLLQIPKKGGYRRLFKPDEGHVMVVADYSGMEMRIVAEMSGDPFLIEAFRNGEDVHGKMTAQIFETDDYTEQQRDIGKMANFLLLYGGEANKLYQQSAAKGIPMSKEKAIEVIKKQREIIAGAWRWIRRNQLQAVKRGWTATALGRKRYFESDGYSGEVERAGGNHPVQGSNADITKLAMVVVDALLAPIGGRVCLQVYDEIVATVPKAYAEYAAQVVQFSMEEAAKSVLKRVPVVVDCHICNSWDEEDLLTLEESLSPAA